MTRQPQTNNFARFLKAWGPALAYMGIIFLLSAQSRLPQPPGFLAWDKLQHSGAYLVLGLLIFRASGMMPPARLYPAAASPYAWALLLGALYGASDEFHQKFVPGRSMDAHDWLADITGIAVGLGAIWILRKYMGREKNLIGGDRFVGE